MAIAIDVAMALVNMSIDEVKKTGNKEYLMDFIKMNQLLYIGQAAMLKKNHRPLFKDDIFARDYGAYVEHSIYICKRRGFGEIEDKFLPEEYVIPSPARIEVLEWLIMNCGSWDDSKLLNFVKFSPPYLEASGLITDTCSPVIKQDSLVHTFDEQTVLDISTISDVYR